MVATTDVEEACKDVNIAVMVGGFPRKEGMERKDVMAKNVSIYKAQASALEKYAAKDVKVGFLKDTRRTCSYSECSPFPMILACIYGLPVQDFLFGSVFTY